MHRIMDDILINTVVLKRFEAEAELEEGDGRFYALIHRRDGRFLAHNPIGPELDGSQSMFAQDLLRRLNRELHHDGAWAIVFTHPRPDDLPGHALLASVPWQYARFAIIFIDRDGDPAFTLEWVQGDGDEFDFADVMLSGIESWCDRCETAWQSWRHLMHDVLDPAEGQTFRRAQGETPRSTQH